MSDVIRDSEADYKTSRSLPPLEVPPDLSTSSIEDSMVVPDAAPAGGPATYSDYASERPAGGAVRPDRVLPNVDGIRVERDRDKRWLVVPGEPDQYWDRVREFWMENGLVINMEDPNTGIMETDWAENRADIPQGFIRSMLGKVGDFVYSSATRDKFRIRFERGVEQDTTEIFITHRGAEEVEKTDARIIWEPRPSDPELEAEMLNRLMVYLGVSKESAEQMIASKQTREARAHMVRDADGQVALDLRDDFSRAWRRTGLALDRVGFTVQDRDRSQGIYFVRYVDPFQDTEEKGLFSKIFKGKKNEPRDIQYQVSLISSDGMTRVVVLDKEGQRDNSDTAGRILSLLHEQLR
ncbi:MAG: outer membrane protein assembly factor BamC [Gammaproteobacteria bacterium]|nr:outer membrane protein assembly factor BamC [Gammaproteobacteria bacterium]